MYYSTTKKLGSKNQKKNLCRGPSLALGKGDLCRGLGQWPSAKKIFLKKIKNLCRVLDGGHSTKTDARGRRDPSGHIYRGPICRGLGPRQRFILPRAYLCRGLLGLALGK